MIRRIIAASSLLLALAGCNRDPKEAGQQLLETGNKYFDNGKFREASIIYRRAINKDKMFGEAYYRLGLAEQNLGRLNQALSAFTRSIQISPENEDAYGRLGDLYVAVYISDPKRYDGLLSEIQRVTEQAEQYYPDSLDVHRIRGFVSLAQGNYEAALTHFEVANKRAPEDKRIALGLVQSMAASGQRDEAMAIALRHLEESPDYSGMYDFVYAQHILAKNIENGARILQTKCDRNPDQLLFRIQLARHYLLAKDLPAMNRVLGQVIEEVDRFPKAQRAVGDFYYEINDYDRAMEVYRKGIEEQPSERASLQSKMVETLAVLGRPEEAFRIVEETLADFPEHGPSLALRGALRLQSRDRNEIEAATTDLEAALTQMPDNPVLRFDLAEAYMAQGNVDRAIVEYQAAIEKRSNYLRPHYRLASIYLTRGEYGKSVAETEQILAFNPNDIQAKLLRSAAWLRMGQVKQAKSSLEEIVEAQPDAVDAIHQLAIINLRQREFREAERLFTMLHSRVPPDRRGILGLAELYIAEGRADKAVALVRDAAAATPDDVSMQLTYCRVLYSARRYDEALEKLLAIREKRTDDAMVENLLGSVYYMQEKLDESEAHFKRTLELAPSDPNPLFFLAMIAERRGAMSQAISVYEQLLEMLPDHALAMNNLAYILAETTTDLDRSLSLIQKARSRAPNDLNIADTLGYIYVKKNLPDSALPILTEIVDKHPKMVIWRFHLAMALYAKGRTEEARSHLKIALGNQPSDEERYMIQELLDKTVP